MEGESSQSDKWVPDEGLVKLLNYSYLKNSIIKFCNFLDNKKNHKCFFYKCLEFLEISGSE